MWREQYFGSLVNQILIHLCCTYCSSTTKNKETKQVWRIPRTGGWWTASSGTAWRWLQDARMPEGGRLHMGVLLITGWDGEQHASRGNILGNYPSRVPIRPVIYDIPENPHGPQWMQRGDEVAAIWFNCIVEVFLKAKKGSCTPVVDATIVTQKAS